MQMSPWEQKRLRDLVGENRRRAGEALRLYRPRPSQLPFHLSRASERVLRGGVRSGKTVGACIEVASACLGIPIIGPDNIPLPFTYPIDRPLVVWVIGFDQKHISRMHRKLFRPGLFRIIEEGHKGSGQWRAWMPWRPEDAAREHDTRPSAPLIPERMVAEWGWDSKVDRVFNVCRLTNGTEIFAFPSGGEAGKGEAVDIIWIDEDIMIPNHVEEWQSRLSDNRGRLIWSAWPYSSNDALVRMSQRAHDQRNREKPDVQEWVLRFSDNPYIPDDEKRKRLDGWAAAGDAVVRSRDMGEFATDSVLVFPRFDVDRHGIPRAGEPDALERALAANNNKVPSSWTRYVVLDPGHTQPAVLFAAVPPPDVGDYVIAEDELYIPRIGAAELAREVAKKLNGKPVEAFVIDGHAARQTPMGLAGTTYNDIYSNAFAAAGLVSRTTGSGFMVGSDDIDGRNMLVREWLETREDGTTKFRCIRETTPNLQHEFLLYKKKITRDDVSEKTNEKKNDLMACFSSDTDILSINGWKRFSDLLPNEAVATVNLATDRIEYQAPSAHINRSYSGAMVHFGGRRMDLLVTPDHRMVVHPHIDNGPEVREAKDVRRTDRLKLTGVWDAESTECVRIPHAYNGVEPDRYVLSTVMAELLGWYIAEGCADSIPKCPGHGYRVAISQFKPNGLAALAELLPKTPWKWVKNDGGYYCSSKQLWEYLHPLGNCYTKRVPEWVRFANSDVIRAFVDGAIAGDGHVSPSGQRTYYTVSKGLADDMQELFLKIGRSARITTRPAGEWNIEGRSGPAQENYFVTEWRRPLAGLTKHDGTPTFKTTNYQGTVHCVTVPNGTLIVRRNGMPVVSGNCLGYIASIRPTYTPPDPAMLPKSPTYLAHLEWDKTRADDGPVFIGCGVPTYNQFAA